MDDEKYANELLEEARAYFPLLFKKVASYRVYAPMALLIELPDGKVFLFDSLNQTTTRLPDNDNNMTKEQTGRVFGILLRRVMAQKGFTQIGLAEATGLRQCQICNYTYGRSVPSYYAFDKIVRALGCSAEDLRYVK